MDRLSPERRIANMSQIRGENTAAEMAVRRCIHNLGFRFGLALSCADLSRRGRGEEGIALIGLCLSPDIR
jgi:G:T-mismatch repair DNA endonuclease (very short patch repair protein)